MSEAELERRRRQGRDLERRLRALGFDVRPGSCAPLEVDDLHRSPAAVETTSDRVVAGGPVMTGRIRRYFETPITVR